MVDEEVEFYEYDKEIAQFYEDAEEKAIVKRKWIYPSNKGQKKKKKKEFMY